MVPPELSICDLCDLLPPVVAINHPGVCFERRYFSVVHKRGVMVSRIFSPRTSFGLLPGIANFLQNGCLQRGQVVSRTSMTPRLAAISFCGGKSVLAVTLADESKYVKLPRSSGQMQGARNDVSMRDHRWFRS